MARGPKPQIPVELTKEELEQLRQTARLRKAPHWEVLRAKILLLAWEHADWTNEAIARKVGCSSWVVWKWRKRWSQKRGIAEAPRPGVPRFFSLSTESPGDGPRLHSA